GGNGTTPAASGGGGNGASGRITMAYRGPQAVFT
ncbi:MAG: hypothetical protein JWP97_2513, partial [Labilithrix sp.]|nr:hypothetical protein [Labilithrix sp.]